MLCPQKDVHIFWEKVKGALMDSGLGCLGLKAASSIYLALGDSVLSAVK